MYRYIVHVRATFVPIIGFRVLNYSRNNSRVVGFQLTFLHSNNKIGLPETTLKQNEKTLTRKIKINPKNTLLTISYNTTYHTTWVSVVQ